MALSFQQFQALRQKGLSNDQIHRFEGGYIPPKTQVQPSFLQNVKQGAINIGKDILGIEQNKSTSFIPSILRSTIGSQGLAGIAQMPGRVIDMALHPEEPGLTPGQTLGTTLNAGLTSLTGGAGSLAKSAGLTGIKSLGVRVAENAALGTGFQAGQNLVDKKPVGTGLKTAAIIGGTIPVAGTGLSAVKNKILGQVTPAAEQMINSLIKPLSNDFAYGKNPAQGILKEGIVANNLNDLSQKVSGKITEVGGKIGALGGKLEQSGITLNLTPALAPIDSAIQVAAKNNNPSLFHSLQNVKVALLHDLQVGADEKGIPAIVKGEAKNLITASYNEAKQFLTDIAEHTRFTGNPSDDRSLNMATKQAYGVARDIMNKTADKVDTTLGKEIRDLNSRYGDLLSARSAINHRDIVLKRQNILKLADRFAIPISIAGAVMTGLGTGDWGKAGVVLTAEIVGVGLARGLGSTASMTRVAQFLSKLAPEERQGILNSTPAIKNVWERITGQTTPADGTPKTQTLQTIEDWIKNPKLGLSIEDITKKGEGVIPKTISQAKASGQSFDEWVKGQGETVYHGTDENAKFLIDREGFKMGNESSRSVGAESGVNALGEGIYFAKDANEAAFYTGSRNVKDVVEAYLPKDIKLKEFTTDTFAEFWDKNKIKSTKQISNILKKEGYDGIIKNGEISIFDPSKIKTRSQLKAEWDKTPSKTMTASEAKASGQSFDEWVKGQGEIIYRGTAGKELDNGRAKSLVGVPFTKDKGVAEFYSKPLYQAGKEGEGMVHELVLPKNAKTVTFPDDFSKKVSDNIIDRANKKWEASGFEYDIDEYIFQELKPILKSNVDAISMPLIEKGQIRVLNKDILKTRSQLKAEWDKAGKINLETYKLDKNTIELRNINIPKELQGQGVGKAQIEKIFKENPNVNRIVGYSLPESKGFFQKLGAKFIDENRFHLNRAEWDKAK